MKVQIKHRYTGVVLFECEAASAKETLCKAVVSDANLSYADLRCANLSGADLSGTNLSYTNLSCADLSGANLSGAKFMDATPLVTDLDAKLLSLIESGDGELNMASWHTCETTHCRAGWAVTLGGEKGRELERKVGTATAGAFIYWRAYGYVPNFYATDEEALADIVANAEGR